MQVSVYHGHLPVSTNYKCSYEKDKCLCSKNTFSLLCKVYKESSRYFQIAPFGGRVPPCFLLITGSNFVQYSGIDFSLEWEYHIIRKWERGKQYEVQYKLISKARTACARSAPWKVNRRFTTFSEGKKVDSIYQYYFNNMFHVKHGKEWRMNYV